MTNETDFYRRTEAWLDRLLELNPVAATDLGEHRWDDRLADYTAEALESQHQEMREALAEFEGMYSGDFSTEAQIDHTVMTHILESLVREFERVESHRRNPGVYVEEAVGGIFLLILNPQRS